MKKLCNMYLQQPALSRWDDTSDGFCWLDCSSPLRRCYTIKRTCDSGAPIVAVFNFSDVLQEHYTLNIGAGKKLKLLLDSTEDKYGGCAPHYSGTMSADANGNVTFNVPRYSAAYYELVDAPAGVQSAISPSGSRTRKRTPKKKTT